MDKTEPSDTVGGNVNWCSYNGKIIWRFLKKLNRSSNPTPGNIPRKDENSNLKRYTHSKVIAKLFTIAKTWKQPKYPLIDEWIKKMWYTYTMEY